jgi:protocatechuate 3,4-dioxygenase beta subunit
MPIALLLILLVAQEVPVAEATLSGTAIDSISGAILTKVQIFAESVDGKSPAASTTTDEKGNFTLVRLAPGEYRLKATRNGYLDTYYGARRAESPGRVLTLAAGTEQKGLQLKLIPFAVIAGTVRDPEGEPVADAKVVLIGIGYQNGRRQLRATEDSATTDDLGQYRIPYVRPGSYYLRAGPWHGDPSNREKTVDHSPKGGPPREVLVPVFAPGVSDITSARKIEVAAGDRVAGVDISLGHSRLFRVRIKMEGPPGTNLEVRMVLRPDLSDGLGPYPASDCKAGSCEFSNVPSGPYVVVGSASPPKVTMAEFFSNNGTSYARVPVDVTDSDLEGIHLTMNAVAEISGQIVVPEDYLAPLGGVIVKFVDAEGEEYSAQAKEDRSFTASLAQGHYEVSVNVRGDLVPKSVQSEGVDLLNNGLSITTSGKIPMEIRLAPEGGKIDGVVQDTAGAHVVLVPELRARHDLYQSTNTDQFGRYHFDSVSPGSYKLFVWSDVETGIWFDPEFMKSEEDKGVAVTLNAKGHENVALHLPDVK